MSDLPDYLQGDDDDDWPGMIEIEVPRETDGREHFSVENIHVPKIERPRSVGFRRASELIHHQRDTVYVLEGTYERGHQYGVIGPPKHGKSVIVLDQACCIALGKPWAGFRTEKAPVFILAGEGHTGINRRLRAWVEYHGDSLDDAELYVSERAAQMLMPLDALAVTNEIEDMAAAHGAPGLIVIDTLARNFGPGDENSTADMTAFVTAVDQTLATLGATIVIVHHTPLASRERPRGSTALLGALDGVFTVAKDDDATTVTTWRAGDQKDVASREQALAFELIGQPIPGAEDNFGNSVTAVVAKVTAVPVVVTEPKGKNQKLAMRILREMYANGATHVPITQWRERFVEETDAKNTRDAWQAVKNAAYNNSWCVIQGPHAYPPEVSRSE
jgi:hypothetical protein